MPTQIKLRAGRYRIPVSISKEKNRLFLEFPYNPDLLQEVKVMEGATWHGRDEEPRKAWSIKDSPGNRLRLDYLQGKNPYAKWERELTRYEPTRSLYAHQLEMVRHGLTVHYGIWAAELGTGKSLAAIELMEASCYQDVFWAGPRSALISVKLELEKWQSRVMPRLLTYEGLKKVVKEWRPDDPVPHILILDEASRVKNPSAERSQAARWLADLVRETWGDEGYVILMSGTPAPRSPADWWNLAEIACPGFLREGSIEKFRQRLALYQKQEGIDGQGFNKLVTWWDDERKCAQCGQPEADHDADHAWQASKNEVAHLYKRLKGLVRVFLKKDCLDLPELQFRRVQCRPNADTLNAARLIAAKASTAIEALTLMRELSDGFQYTEAPGPEKVCPACLGKGEREEHVSANPAPVAVVRDGDYRAELVSCSVCRGSGSTRARVRQTIQLPCPKEQALLDLLDEFQDIGRVVIYGGFTASVERCVQIVSRCHWNWIKADGHGWSSDLGPLTPEEMVKRFQNPSDDKFAFIGQPAAAGMGLTLTASPVEIFYSNDFNAESRMQALGRIHRPGADANRGCTIIDLLHLPTDLLVLNNLDTKRDLQSLTLGDIRESLN